MSSTVSIQNQNFMTLGRSFSECPVGSSAPQQCCVKVASLTPALTAVLSDSLPRCQPLDLASRPPSSCSLTSLPCKAAKSKQPDQPMKHGARNWAGICSQIFLSRSDSLSSQLPQKPQRHNHSLTQNPSKRQGCWQLPMISAPKRLRHENCCKFKAILAHSEALPQSKSKTKSQNISCSTKAPAVHGISTILSTWLP